jgi:hypothetical protein
MAGKPIKIAILADGGKAQKAFEGVSKSATKAFGGLGKIAAGAALPVAAAGGLVGVGFASAFTDALDIQDAKAKLTAQLGFGDAESKKAGKVAGDLYKNAYGESLADVNDVLATVFQSGLAKATDAEDAIKGVTEQVLNYSTLTGEEALPVTRAVSQMLKTGLAKNATQAFDILTRGQQLGINKSEDLLDTFNEYGTQFRKIGIDGPTALGLMNQAIRAGARDSDVAADAIKEFSIRAVDGSKLTADSFKALGLNADTMAETFAKGGPKATAALGQVLEKLRAVKDPAEQSRIAVGLFGTQAEDLGAALLAMDPSTAVKGLGELAGAAERAGDTLNDTAKNKLTTVARTLKTAIADAIVKYALPKLEEFAEWFNGPGKFVIVGWALDAASAFLTFTADMLGGLGKVIGGLADYGQVALIAAAASVALINPALAKSMLEQAASMDDLADSAEKGLTAASEDLRKWNESVTSAKTKVKFEADIADLDAKIATAQKALKDPNLTKERKAKLTADIAQATKAKNDLIAKYNDPGLVKTRTAKFAADKRDADAKIAANLKALANPALSATKRAKLEAENAQLIRAAREAQAKIDSLKGKTVPITVKLTYVGGALKGQNSDPTLGGLFPGKYTGGAVLSGRTYLVGEQGPELLTLGSTSGYVTNNRLTQDAINGRNSSNADALGVAVFVEIDGQQLQGRITRTVRDENRNLKRKVRQG